MPRENRVEKSRVHFSCQAQYLVNLECDISWQTQHLVTFWEIAGARNVVEGSFNSKLPTIWRVEKQMKSR